MTKIEKKDEQFISQRCKPQGDCPRQGAGCEVSGRKKLFHDVRNLSIHRHRGDPL